MSQKGAVILLFVCILVIISHPKSFKMEAKFDFSYWTPFPLGNLQNVALYHLTIGDSNFMHHLTSFNS